MAVEQLPADVPISLVPGDEVNFALRFNADLTGYTFSTGVYDAAALPETVAFSPSVVAAIETETPEVGDPVTTTLVSVSFVESQTSQLVLRAQNRQTSWRWYLRWVSPGGVTRTVISGPITSRAP